jgi:hypothetical protein
MSLADETRRRRGKTPSDDQGTSSPPKKTKLKRKRKLEEEPFWKIFVKVFVVLLVICLILSGIYRAINPASSEVVGEDDNYELSEAELENILPPTAAPTRRTAPPLPVWDLSDATQWDAFGLAEQHHQDGNKFWKVTKSIRQEFSLLYGGENAARAVLERGLTTFGKHSKGAPTDLHETACRMHRAKQESRPFSFAFGGYSVTAGRGNFFSQSFPFVMKRMLDKPFKLAGIDLQLINAAIGGVPSFPYGWCLSNFWGADPDVVSWDYSMNEAGGIPEGLEAYLRHVLQLPRLPKLLVKDTHLASSRRDLIRQYVELDLLLDPVVIHTDPAADPFLSIEETFRPSGFQEWRKFGAPPDAPGQAAHHPGVKEHELIGWILGMHFLAALELVVASLEDGSLLQCVETKRLPMPSPLSTNSTYSLFFGVESESHGWEMNKVNCRTSYEPIVSGNLSDVIVSGTSGDGVDILMAKGAMYYTKGWVLDLSEGERLAKRKLDRYGGLGFLDSKKAYYGIFASGPLKIFLPSRGAVHDLAATTIKSLVLCEVNEKYRSEESCKVEKQLGFVVGGANATHVASVDAPGTLYLGHKLCLDVGIPKDARLSVHNDMVGLMLQISVIDKHIYKKERACSISHIVWEEAPWP